MSAPDIVVHKSRLTKAWAEITEEEVRSTTFSAVERFQAIVKDTKGSFFEIWASCRDYMFPVKLSLKHYFFEQPHASARFSPLLSLN